MSRQGKLSAQSAAMGFAGGSNFSRRAAEIFCRMSSGPGSFAASRSRPTAGSSWSEQAVAASPTIYRIHSAASR